MTRTRISIATCSRKCLEMKEEEWGNENDNSFIDAEWVLFSWDRFKRELAREKDKLVAAIRKV